MLVTLMVTIVVHSDFSIKLWAPPLYSNCDVYCEDFTAGHGILYYCNPSIHNQLPWCFYACLHILCGQCNLICALGHHDNIICFSYNATNNCYFPHIKVQFRHCVVFLCNQSTSACAQLEACLMKDVHTLECLTEGGSRMLI